MRQLTTLLFVLFSFAISYAQTEEQTLEWLNTKKTEISISYSYGTNVEQNTPSKKLTIDSDKIKLESTNGAYVSIDWSSVKNIKEDWWGLYIITNKMYDGRNLQINLNIEREIKPKYLKALKHMATLKGAKLIDDDLF